MALKYAVLGLLSERRSYGYNLVQNLTDRLGPAWQLSASTVYTALDQLLTDGLIRGCSERRGQPSIDLSRGENRRVMYEATPAGRQAFAAWIARPSLRQEPIRGELYLKVAMAPQNELPALLDAIDLAGRLTQSNRDECLNAAEPSRGSRWQRRAAGLVRAAAVSRLEAELRWLEAVRQALTAGSGNNTVAADLSQGPAYSNGQV